MDAFFWWTGAVFWLAVGAVGLIVSATHVIGRVKRSIADAIRRIDP